MSMRNSALLLFSGCLCLALLSAGCKPPPDDDSTPPPPAAPPATAPTQVLSRIAAGDDFSCSLFSQTNVFCWGANTFGQLGNGSYDDSNHPVIVGGYDFKDVAAVHAGALFACALKENGTVWCWGANGEGQLGDNSGSDHPLPVQVSGVTTAVALAVGENNACIILDGGSVMCWGANYQGALGVGDDRASSPVPAPVSGIESAIAISAAGASACAVLADHAVRCWGDNRMGQLGNNSAVEYSNLPVPVFGIGNAVGVSAAGSHSCAVLSTGTVACWGITYADLPGATPAPAHSPVPVLVPGLLTAIAVSSGNDFNCALIEGGKVKCWGSGYRGQLGNGSDADSGVPVQVSSIDHVTGLSAGYEHACAIIQDLVTCWGDNERGQLGDWTYPYATHPSPVSGITNAVLVSPSETHSCALLADGHVMCWGNHDFIGDGLGLNSTSPVTVTGLDQAVDLDAGYNHSCAVRNNGAVWCWGRNAYGQLGDNSNLDHFLAAPVSGTTTALSVSAGNMFSCAVLEGGSVQCWGYGYDGQIGNNVYDHSYVPTDVLGISNAVGVSAGYTHACAVLDGGSVKCWGGNREGQLGSGSYEDRSAVPEEVTGISTAVAVAAGSYLACALLDSGSVACWGTNNFGTLGSGDSVTAWSNVPVPVAGLSDAVAIAAGEHHVCALLSDATMACWGNNAIWQLGSYTTGDRSYLPVQVSFINDAVLPGAGVGATCAVLASGDIRCWGDNWYGQLGTGRGADHGQYSLKPRVFFSVIIVNL